MGMRERFASLWRRLRGRSPDTSGAGRYKYKAFISYKHSVAPQFAGQFESALKRYAKPFLARPVKIFRDEKHFVPAANLPRLIADALEASEFFILLASPDAAQSPWVRDELDRWCRILGRAERMIVVLIAGRIVIDPETKAIDWTQTDALPASLLEHVRIVPLYVDLRDLVDRTTLTLDEPKFKHAVNGIVARFRDIDPNEMLGEEIQQHRKNLRLRNIVVASLATLTILSSGTAYIAWQQREQARFQRDMAIAQHLTDLSNGALATAPSEAVLLAIEASKATAEPTPAAVQALRNALTKLEGVTVQSGISDVLALAPNGRWIAYGPTFSVKLLLRDIANWSSKRLLPQTGDIYRLVRFSESQQLVTVDVHGEVNYWDLSARRLEPTELAPARDNVTITSLAISPSGRSVAASGFTNVVQVWIRDSEQKFQRIDVPVLEPIGAVAISDPSPEGRVTVAIACGSGGEARYRARPPTPSLAVFTLSVGDRLAPGVGPVKIELPVTALAFGAQGQLLLGDEGGNVSAVRLPFRDGERPVRLTNHTGAVTGVVFQQPYVISAGVDGFVHVVESTSEGYKPLHELHVHDAPIRAIGMRPDGLIDALSEQGSLRSVRLHGNQSHPMRLYEHTEHDADKNLPSSRPLAFASDDRLLAASRDRFVDIWDLTAPQQPPRVIGPFDSRQVAMAFGRANRSLISADEDGVMVVTGIDDGHRRPLATLQGVRRLIYRDASNDILAFGNGPVVKVHADSGHREDVYQPAPPEYGSLGIDEAGRWLFDPVVGEAGGQSIYDVATPATPKWSLRHPGGPGGLAVSSRGNWAVIASHVWDLTRARPGNLPVPSTFRLSRGGLPPFDFDDSGSLLLSMELGVANTEPARAAAVVLSRLHRDPARDDAIVLGHMTWVYDVLVSPTGRWAAGVNRGARIHLWPLHFDELYTIARSAVNRNMTWQEWRRAWPNVPYRKTFDEIPVSASTIVELMRAAESVDAERRQLYASLTQWAIELGDPVVCREVCLHGALAGAADIVIPAGLKAESLTNRNPIVADTVGIALARSGELEQAIERFEYFVRWASTQPESQERVALRQKWIAELKQGRIPAEAMFDGLLTRGWWGQWPPD